MKKNKKGLLKPSGYNISKYIIIIIIMLSNNVLKIKIKIKYIFISLLDIIEA